VDRPDERIGYIRGGGVEIDSRRATRVVVGFCLVVLVALVIFLTLSAVSKNASIGRLQRHGVPVDVTVTSCVALASGTGATITGYTCRGTFTLHGHRYNEVIGGSIDLHPVGQTLHAVTDPGDPSTLSTARAVRTTHRSWTAFIPAAIALVLLVLVLALVLRRHRRGDTTSGTAPPPATAPPATAPPAEPAALEASAAEPAAAEPAAAEPAAAEPPTAATEPPLPVALGRIQQQLADLSEQLAVLTEQARRQDQS
jgi:hypothetical protein